MLYRARCPRDPGYALWCSEQPSPQSFLEPKEHEHGGHEECCPHGAQLSLGLKLQRSGEASTCERCCQQLCVISSDFQSRAFEREAEASIPTIVEHTRREVRHGWRCPPRAAQALGMESFGLVKLRAAKGSGLLSLQRGEVGHHESYMLCESSAEKNDAQAPEAK